MVEWKSLSIGGVITVATAFTVIFVIICIALTIVVLLQEGKSAGLGVVNGSSDTYWGKNKGRSVEGTLEKITRVLVILFLVIALVLNIIA
ncbi:MAG: preprotein translocase subunit SecG [Lachnospiraceae bacterium]|nr:preprotein translocase subunit SecG [Lachnospiraceae bacterium]